MYLTAVITIILALAAAFVTADPVGRIVGGFPISIETVPYQVSLQMVEIDGEVGHFCGGSIISESYILTASHCVEGLVLRDLAILVGTQWNDQKPQRNIVKRIIMNRQYDTEMNDYDIALLELKKPLTLSDKIQPIPLANVNDKIPDGTMCLVSGWGDTNRQNQALKRLRAVEVPIVNQQECNKNLAEFGGVTSRMLCAGHRKGGKDSCQGDSGGPLACAMKNRDGNRTLVGVVSWGIDCGKPNMPGVYTRITSVRQWIRNNAGI